MWVDRESAETVKYPIGTFWVLRGLGEMARFKQTLPDTAFDILWKECQERNIPTVSELVRSVIIPDWVRRNVTKAAVVAPAESGETADVEAKNA